LWRLAHFRAAVQHRAQRHAALNRRRVAEHDMRPNEVVVASLSALAIELRAPRRHR
jgi:hypothetical protein